MKFTKQLEEYSLPEWKGRYLRYRFLKKRLHDIAEGRGQAAVDQLLATEGSGAESFVFKGPRNSFGSSDVQQRLRIPPHAGPDEVWRLVVEAEALRIASTVDQGFEELKAQFAELSSLAFLDSSCPSVSQQSRYMELRALQAVGRVAEGLSRLRSYTELNHAALFKILKKHDKMLGENTGLQEHYPRLVEATGLSEMSRFEDLDAKIKRVFVKSATCAGLEGSPEVALLAAGLGTVAPNQVSLAGGERTLFFFLGSSAALFATILVLILLPSEDPSDFNTAYFLSSFSVFRIVFSVLLTMWGAGCVSKLCQDYYINHLFLLGIDPRCRVGHSFLFSRAAVLTSLWILIFSMYIIDYKWMVFPQFRERYSWHYVLYPCVLLSLTIAMLVSPSRICRYRYRSGIMRSVGRTCLAPFYPVTFGDNIVGDIMTSLAKPLQDIPPAFCYLGSRADLNVERFKEYGDVCPDWERSIVAPLIGGAAFLFRLWQCARRFYDTRDRRHLWNLGKYATSLLVVIVSRILGQRAEAVILVSVIATSYSAIWDVSMDWGLGLEELALLAGWEGMAACARRCSRFFGGGSQSARELPSCGGSMTPAAASEGAAEAGLASGNSTRLQASQTGSIHREASSTVVGSAVLTERPKRAFGPGVYWTAVVLDIILRLTWVITLMPITLLTDNIVQRAVLQTAVASAEICRRSMWTVFRLEYEQASNASGYRALLWVPMKMSDREEHLLEMRPSHHNGRQQTPSTPLLTAAS